MSKRSDVKSPEGMKVVASTREEPQEALEAKHDEIRTVAASEELKDFACGHRAPSSIISTSTARCCTATAPVRTRAASAAPNGSGPTAAAARFAA